MLRRSLLAMLVLASLACMVQNADAAGHQRRGKVIDYMFGGYGPGLFGRGNLYYGQPPSAYTPNGRLIR